MNSNSDLDRVEAARRLQSERFSRYFLLAALVLMLVIFFNMVKMFTSPVLLAAVFSTLFYPLYRTMYNLVGRPGVSAFLCCMIILVGLLVPLYLVGTIVTQQAINFINTAEDRVSILVEQGEQGPLGKITNWWVIRRLNWNAEDWAAVVRDAAGAGGKVAATVIRKTSGGALYFFANIFITLFIMFYFFRDGNRLIDRMRSLIPLRDIYIDAIISRFISVSRGTIKGVVLIGLSQSTLGAITLWIFGVGQPMLWWVVMSICAMIPVIGAWVVMYPAGIIQILIGNVWQGVGILLITAFVISMIDNIFRPRLVGRTSGMHDLIIFFAALGGLRTFGPVGVIVGPVIAAFVVAILDIYSTEFRPQLGLNSEEEEKPLAVRS